jgi:methylated-DNA-[protein]-cysteine S-methyltransferase
LKGISQFQREVYRAVSRIPLGQVRSYSWVAKEIKRPKAVRAVGTALKNNPFAPLIPCHRVINSDGSLGGYSRGLKRKRELLRLEEEILKSGILETNRRRKNGYQ